MALPRPFVFLRNARASRTTPTTPQPATNEPPDTRTNEGDKNRSIPEDNPDQTKSKDDGTESEKDEEIEYPSTRVVLPVVLSIYLTVFLSPVATSVFARLNTFWNSDTRALIRECIYAFEHLM